MSITVHIPDAPSQPTRPAPRQREKVLVVLSSDGWAEVYAGKHVDVEIVNRLHVVDAGPGLASDLDKYLELSIPQCYRELYFPNLLRASGQVERITLEDEGGRLADVRTLREIRDVQKSLEGCK